MGRKWVVGWVDWASGTLAARMDGYPVRGCKVTSLELNKLAKALAIS